MSAGGHSEGHSHTRSAAGVPSLGSGCPEGSVDQLFEGHQRKVADYYAK